MVENFGKRNELNIFESVIEMKRYFGYSEEEAYKYLSEDNKEKLKLCAAEMYKVKLEQKESDIFS